MKIILALDGVLADFVGGACRRHGITKDEFHARHPVGAYKVHKTLGLTMDEFWKPIHENEVHFWRGLEPTPRAQELIDLVRQVTPDWYIVSSPSCSPESYSGKAAWLKDFFGADFDRFAITPHKHLFANPQTLLIDDREWNVDRFIEAGGLGFLFPTRYNKQHRFAEEPLEELCHYFLCGFSEPMFTS